MRNIPGFCLALYCIFYAFESPIRYGLSLAHADEAIFLRDFLLAVPLACIFLRQCAQKDIHPAFLAFFAIISIHGLVMALNTHSALAVLYSAKMLMGMLAGAIASTYFFAPGRCTVWFFLALWTVSVAGIALDKYAVDFPWTGLHTTIADMHVDISRDWEVTGDAKRAGGFMRSSINAAIVLPLMAFLLVFHCRDWRLKACIAITTFAALCWTTQKGALVAYGFTLALIAVAPLWRIALLKGGFFAFMLLMIALPLVLPGLHMPHSDGVLMSFNLRVEETWPEGWRWIARHQLFPFGIGLGGLGGAQRTWSPGEYTAGDNLFLFLYANFGLLALAYLGWLACAFLKVNTEAAPGKSQAMATLMFLMGYGFVLSLIEDQMALVFFGAATAWLAGQAREGSKVTALP